jgi:hypothetical protein
MNPDPAHRAFELTFSLLHSGEAGITTFEEDDVLNSRTVRLEDRAPGSSAPFEQAGLLLRMFSGVAGEAARLELDVTDSCGRVGVATHDYVY